MHLNSLSLIQASQKLRSKTVSSQELTQACLDRIESTNVQLNSFLTLNPNALSLAKKADSMIHRDPSILKSKPLFGLPYAIKDNFLTQGLRTTASSKVLDEFIPPFNATVVAKLDQAGAILLGKTNMDAWAHGSSTETSDYGPTKNPWNLNHLPGGSSGGSTAAVAAHQCIFAIGSETAGSIRQPAAWCGVTGFKPTYGRVSRYGVIAMASSTDSPGPIGKTVLDTIHVLNAVAGPDPLDATSIKEKMLLSLDEIKKPLKGKKIGLPPEYLLKDMDQKVKQLILDVATHLESLGCQIIPLSLLDPHYAIGVYTILQRSEVSSNLARYDGIRYGHDRSYFGEEAKRRVMLGTYSLSTGYYDQYYTKAQKVRTLIVKDFDRAFQKVDAIIGPTSPGPALPLGATKDAPMFGEMEDILVEASSIAGLTSISVPCGFVNDLPIGVQITAAQKQESLVAHIAYQYQNTTTHHVKQPSI